MSPMLISRKSRTTSDTHIDPDDQPASSRLFYSEVSAEQSTSPFVYSLKKKIMFSLFKKSSPIDRMNKQYQELMKKAMEASKTDRRKADELYAEAEALVQQLEGRV